MKDLIDELREVITKCQEKIKENNKLRAALDKEKSDLIIEKNKIVLKEEDLKLRTKAVAHIENAARWEEKHREGLKEVNKLKDELSAQIKSSKEAYESDNKKVKAIISAMEGKKERYEVELENIEKEKKNFKAKVIEEVHKQLGINNK